MRKKRLRAKEDASLEDVYILGCSLFFPTKKRQKDKSHLSHWFVSDGSLNLITQNQNQNYTNGYGRFSSSHNSFWVWSILPAMRESAKRCVWPSEGTTPKWLKQFYKNDSTRMRGDRTSPTSTKDASTHTTYSKRLGVERRVTTSSRTPRERGISGKYLWPDAPMAVASMDPPSGSGSTLWHWCAELERKHTDLDTLRGSHSLRGAFRSWC